MHFSAPSQQGRRNGIERTSGRHSQPSSSCFHRTGYNQSRSSQVGNLPRWQGKLSIELTSHFALNSTSLKWHSKGQLRAWPSNVSQRHCRERCCTGPEDKLWDQTHSHLAQHSVPGKPAAFRAESMGKEAKFPQA